MGLPPGAASLKPLPMPQGLPPAGMPPKALPLLPIPQPMPMPTPVALQEPAPSISPPLPASGLPEGWTTEQWQHYGQQWLDRQ